MGMEIILRSRGNKASTPSLFSGHTHTPAMIVVAQASLVIYNDHCTILSTSTSVSLYTMGFNLKISSCVPTPTAVIYISIYVVNFLPEYNYLSYVRIVK